MSCGDFCPFFKTPIFAPKSVIKILGFSPKIAKIRGTIPIYLYVCVYTTAQVIDLRIERRANYKYLRYILLG